MDLERTRRLICRSRRAAWESHRETAPAEALRPAPPPAVTVEPAESNAAVPEVAAPPAAPVVPAAPSVRVTVTQAWHDAAERWRLADGAGQARGYSVFREELAQALGVEPRAVDALDDYCFALSYQRVRWVFPYPDAAVRGFNLEKFYHAAEGRRVSDVRAAGFIHPESANQNPRDVGPDRVVVGELEVC